MVYEYALGGNTIELEFSGHQPFVVPEDSGHRNLLALPRTCYLAYVEAIQSVYKLNKLSVSQTACLALLPTVIAPPLISCIRTFKINLEIDVTTQGDLGDRPHKKSTFDRAWEVAASLRGLKALYVQLTGYGVGYPLLLPKQEEKWSLTLGQIPADQLDVFRVTINWQPRTDAWTVPEGRPFEFVVELGEDLEMELINSINEQGV